MCELLAGAFTGGGTSGPVDARGRIANGMLSIYISPKHFGTADAFKQTAEDYVAWVKSCRADTPGGEVLAPGEPEARLRAERLAKGVPLQPDTWESIVRCARALGVTVPN
jgi:hydroxycarboxylate dehydrogenase B